MGKPFERRTGSGPCYDGEGEITFAHFLKALLEGEDLKQVPGLMVRNADGTFTDTGFRQVMDMSQIPFPYAFMDMKELEHRIIYYESSRGCPFSCAYCLSSIDKKLRFRSLDLVLPELEWFLQAKVPQVKFVDRTFNCKSPMQWLSGSISGTMITALPISILRLQRIC